MIRSIFITMIFMKLFYSVSGAEVLDIMDVLPEIFKTKSLKRAYVLRLDEVIYRSESVSDFLVLTIATADSYFVSGKLTITRKPAETLIFDHDNYYTTIKNRSFVSLIPATGSYLVNSPYGDSAWKSEIFGLSGQLIKSFVGPDVNVSPDGKYYYTRIDPANWRPLIVYDSELNEKLQFPFKDKYLVNALPNGLIAAAEKDRVYLYDAVGEDILWKLELQKRGLIIDESYNIRFSPKGDIIVARDKTQVHFINTKGNLLWSNNSITAGYSIGVSGGDNVVSFAVGSYSYLIFQLYDMTGKKITDADNNIGSDLTETSVWDRNVYVNNKFQIARFTAKNTKTNEKLYITGICVNDDDRYTVYAVDGLWYYLEKNDKTGTLVGFENDRKEIIAYPVVLK